MLGILFSRSKILLKDKPPNKRLFCCNPLSICATMALMETKRHNLYLPLELYEKLQFLADKDLRTFNKECVFLLTQIVEMHRDELIDFEQEKKEDE